MRAAAAETARLAQIENERIASEQAAERQHLSDLIAAQEAIAASVAAKATASLRAEREALDKAAADAQAVLAAEAQRLADERQAFEDEKAAVAAAAQKEIAHADAIVENEQFDAEKSMDAAKLSMEGKIYIAFAPLSSDDPRTCGKASMSATEYLAGLDKNPQAAAVFAAFADAPIDEDEPIIDVEAIAWAYQKLLALGVGGANMEDAIMLDRLNFMLKAGEVAA